MSKNKIHLIKQSNNTFILANDSDFETAKKIKPGNVYAFEFTKPRNYEFHKKFFALIKMLYDNQEYYDNIEHLRKDLIITAGYYEHRYGLDGQELIEAKSLSFGAMDEFQFNELYNSVINVIVEKFNFNRQDIIDNVLQYY